jgi:hypothetical protein
MPRLTIPLLVAALWCPASALAQTAGAPAVDPNKLGVDLDRIKREVSTPQAETREDAGLKLSYRVEVYGQAPPIDIIGDFNVKTGPVPGSGPTHQDMIDQVTPQEYRAPAASFSNLVYWLTTVLSERSAKERCEKDLAEYRAQVMAGMKVSAPTCAQ